MTRPSSVRLLLLLGVLPFWPCATARGQIKIIVHDQAAAAKSAEQFARVAFVDKDYAKAQGLLAPEMRKTVTVEKLVEIIKRMHPAAMPSEVKATEYAPEPGQRAMNIFLHGKAGAEEFFYRLYMTGDSPSGYRVAGVFRGSGPYPTKTKKPL